MAQCILNRCKDLFKRKKDFGVMGTLNVVRCVVKCCEPIRIRMKSAGKLGARVRKHASSRKHGKTCNIYGKKRQKVREGSN